MKSKYWIITCIPVFLFLLALFSGCGDDERAAVDQPPKSEELAKKDEPREDNNEGIIRRDEIQGEKQVIQEKTAERQNPKADIPMPTADQEQTVDKEPGNPYDQRELGGAERTAELAQGKEAMQIDKDMIGKQVMSEDGQKLGKAIDIYRGLEGGSDYVLVENIDKRIYPVPVDLFRPGPRSEGLEVSLDRLTFEKAPSIQETEKKLLYDPDFEQRVRGYYREQGLSTAQ